MYQNRSNQSDAPGPGGYFPTYINPDRVQADFSFGIIDKEDTIRHTPDVGGLTTGSLTDRHGQIEVAQRHPALVIGHMIRSSHSSWTLPRITYCDHRTGPRSTLRSDE